MLFLRELLRRESNLQNNRYTPQNTRDTSKLYEKMPECSPGKKTDMNRPKPDFCFRKQIRIFRESVSALVSVASTRKAVSVI